jgi:hypothetical protein
MQVPKDYIRERILSAAVEIMLKLGFLRKSTKAIAKKAEAFEQIYWNIFDNEKEMIQYIELQSSILLEMIRKYRVGIILITDCSKGTKYESCKARLITHLADSHLAALKSIVAIKNKDIIKDKFLLHIVSMNYVEGIIEIARNY